MERRLVLLWAAVFALITIVSIPLIDRPLAGALYPHLAGFRAFFGPPLRFLEIVTGFGVSKWLLGAALVVIGGIAAALGRRHAGSVLIFIGTSHLMTRLIAGVLKNVFARPRPFEALSQATGGFFTAGSSFPSGHAAHFWPLFFAALIAVPRLRWPLGILAAFVSVARIAVDDHYLSDVTASAAIAALVAAGLAALFARLPAGLRAGDSSLRSE